ncbi:MAG: DPP IV N-terminal domain-containing protein [Planctomycetota bacterium]
MSHTSRAPRPSVRSAAAPLALPAAFALLAAFAPTGAAQQKPLTFADLGERVRWTTSPPRCGFAADGTTLWIESDDGRRFVDLATGEEVPEPAARERAPEPRIRIVRGAVVLEDGAGGEPRTIAESDAAKRLAQLAPGARAASWVEGSQLRLAAVDGSWSALLGDGDPDHLTGVLDWVYQEEVYGRGDFNASWWSPGGDAIAFLELDETKVPSFTVIDHVPERARTEQRGVDVETTRYPKVGDANPTVALAIRAAGADAVVVHADFSSFPQDALVVRVGWTPDGSKAWAIVQDRIQKDADLVLVDPRDGAVTKIVSERSSTWTERPAAPRFLADGTFLWESHRTGHNHLYRYDLAGKLLETVTSGPWRTTGVERVDETAGLVWFTSTQDGAIGSNLYVTPLGDDATVKRLTNGVGTHRVELSDDGRWFTDTWSSHEQPTRVRVADARTGATVREIGWSEVLDEWLLLPTRRLVVEARDGYPLDATVILPPQGAFEGPRPIFLDTYSGPDAPTVRDAFRPSTWLQFLAQRGAIVLQVNVRTASGRGMADTGLCYERLGVQELRDLEDAVDKVVAEFGGDPARVAISGWSYGGFMAGYALTHSDRFALGLAGAGVYDWRLYDSIYTERYMGLPDANRAGYDATSVIEAAGNLRGHLVLMHGTMDDNVHLQNTIQLADALQRAGEQDFEMMLYANSRHGVGSPHLREYRWLRVKQFLGLTD